jgi:hypothetical protein
LEEITRNFRTLTSSVEIRAPLCAAKKLITPPHCVIGMFRVSLILLRQKLVAESGPAAPRITGPLVSVSKVLRGRFPGSALGGARGGADHVEHELGVGQQRLPAEIAATNGTTSTSVDDSIWL